MLVPVKTLSRSVTWIRGQKATRPRCKNIRTRSFTKISDSCWINGQQDRCRNDFDAGSFTRDCGVGGDADAQGHFLPETTDADDL